ncbi:MAG: hypothetical protein ACFB0B_21180 [Thermonemataceae bacterium]
MQHIFKRKFILILLSFTIFLVSCNDDDDETPTPSPSYDADVNLRTDATLGSILVDGEGRTLYFFSLDASGESNCNDNCLNAWPIFYAESPSLSSGLNQGDFGAITRADGSLQTTYKGWPLYYFAPEGDGAIEAPETTNGEGVNEVWFVAKPDYTIMLANAQLVGADGNNYTENYTQGEGVTQYFVDAEGNTLYLFTRDSRNINTFTAEDFSNNDVWPIFEGSPAQFPSTLNADDFGTITVQGRTQLTYKGWPLYRFGQDEQRGDNKGVSVPTPGVWPIVNSNTEAAPVEATVVVRNDATFGNILTDAAGNTLYFFTRDVNGQNNCSGGCAGAWPVFYTPEVVLDEGSGLEVADFGAITLGDGSSQTTYKGYPLYYYAPEGDGVLEPTGEVNGDGAGGVWYVAKDYSLMIADAQLVGADGNNYTSNYTSGDEVTKYFTDANGRTLYIFTNDANNTNNFTNEDFSNDNVWPIFYTEITNLPSGMNAADFGSIMVFGRQQLTYKGWPVYYFGQDTQRGDNKGVSVPTPGVWPIINNGTDDAPMPSS